MRCAALRCVALCIHRGRRRRSTPPPPPPPPPPHTHEYTHSDTACEHGTAWSFKLAVTLARPFCLARCPLYRHEVHRRSMPATQPASAPSPSKFCDGRCKPALAPGLQQ
ncbi:hypothetical protein ACJQWK_06012 [Exserohilum turcicum]